MEKLTLKIHCCVTNEQKKVTCFVMNADNSTMLCREGDVEANDSLQRHFAPSCKVSKCHLKVDAVTTFSLVQGYKHVLFCAM